LVSDASRLLDLVGHAVDRVATTISPRRAQFTITVRHPDGSATVVKVDLARPPRT
jgi:hypothetical protein